MSVSIHNNNFRRQIFICSFDELIMELQLEIIDTYKQFLIKPLRQEHPILIIRAPVPWHQSKLMAGHFMHHNLFIGNEILRNIQSLYFTK